MRIIANHCPNICPCGTVTHEPELGGCDNEAAALHSAECKIRVESWLAKMANKSQNWSDILSVVWPSNMYYYSLFLRSHCMRQPE